MWLWRGINCVILQKGLNKGYIIISYVKIMWLWIFKFGLTRKYTKLTLIDIFFNLKWKSFIVAVLVPSWHDPPLLSSWKLEWGKDHEWHHTHHRVWVWYAQSPHLLSHIWWWKNHLSIELWRQWYSGISIIKVDVFSSFTAHNFSRSCSAFCQFMAVWHFNGAAYVDVTTCTYGGFTQPLLYSLLMYWLCSCFLF